jgi:TolA-binding protein
MVDPLNEFESSEPQPSPPERGAYESKPAPAPELDYIPPSPSSSSAVEDAPKHPAFPVVVGGGLIVALVLACTTDPQPVPAASTASSTSAAAPAAATPAAEPAADTAALKTELAALSDRVKELQGHIDGLPKPAPAADLAPLQAKVDELAKSSEATAGLGKQLSALDERVAAIDKSIGGLREDIDALKPEAKKPAEPAPATAAPEAAKPAAALATAETLDPTVSLFKSAKYKEANDAFRKLTDSFPKDARVWYFAAVSNGLATNQWNDGETVRLVKKGAELEKADSPDSATIDSSLQILTKASGKDWLDY